MPAYARILRLRLALMVGFSLYSSASAGAAPGGRDDADRVPFARDDAVPALRLRGFFGQGAEIRVSLNSEITGRGAWVAVGEVFEGWSVESINPVRSEVSVRAGATVAIIAMAGESASSRGRTPGLRRSREAEHATIGRDGDSGVAPAEGGGRVSAADPRVGSLHRRGGGVVGARGLGARGAPGAGLVAAAVPVPAPALVGLDSDDVVSAAPGEPSDSTWTESDTSVAGNATDVEGDTGSFPLLSRAHLTTGENLAIASREARRRYMARRRD